MLGCDVQTRHDNVNVTVIRENCEGEYSGLEHEVVPGVVESVKVMSKEGCARIAEFAFEYAWLNNRKKVTAVHKANIQKQADGLFLKVCRDVAKKYPQIQFQVCWSVALLVCLLCSSLSLPFAPAVCSSVAPAFLSREFSLLTRNVCVVKRVAGG